MAGRLLRVGEPIGPADLFIPMKQLFTVEQGTTLKDLENLPHYVGGRAAKPRQPVAFHGADGSVSMVIGAGVTEAAELQDQAYALHAKQVERAKETVAERRERLGLPPPWTPDEFHEYFENVSKAKRQRETELNLDPDGSEHTKRVY